MEKTKSEKITFLGNELFVLDRNIDLVKSKKQLSQLIVFYENDGENIELEVWKDMKQPLEDFLLSFYERKKQDIFNEIKKELNK